MYTTGAACKVFKIAYIVRKRVEFAVRLAMINSGNDNNSSERACFFLYASFPSFILEAPTRTRNFRHVLRYVYCKMRCLRHLYGANYPCIYTSRELVSAFFSAGNTSCWSPFQAFSI